MSVADLNALASGANVYWRDLYGVTDYEATASVTPTKSVTVIPTNAPAVTYPLNRDQFVQFPVFQLN